MSIDLLNSSFTVANVWPLSNGALSARESDRMAASKFSSTTIAHRIITMAMAVVH